MIDDRRFSHLVKFAQHGGLIHVGEAAKVSISTNDKNIINVFSIRLPPKILVIASQLPVSRSCILHTGVHLLFRL